MNYTEFKDKKISRLGFGTMRLPMDDQGKIDYAAGQEMIDYALANGINYIDTAYKYHEGESEDFVGAALAKHQRTSYYLADKLPTWLCSTEDDAGKIFEGQLSKCRTDYFDFYLLHSLDEESWPNVPRLHMIEYLREEKAAGRIRHLGASFHCGPDLLRQVLTDYGQDLEFIQLQLNYMDWDLYGAKELYQIAREFDTPVVVMEPLRGGMLANPLSETARKVLDGTDTGASYASYALRFINELPGILCTLSGMSTLAQMKENIEIFNGPAMIDKEKEAISEAVKVLQADILVPCTGCNYCYECPSGVKIPEIFKMYNEAASKGFHWIWGSLSGQYNKCTPNAKDCIECGACESHCPQKISIIDKLKEIDAKYAQLAEMGE
ncbi:MAG: aldo/keto reductase [Emergencia timonensis]|uniref:aldo/keto reductase n=1 Tax=Emergencia timonensis TaxID=1776384 RepID=UPI000836BF21|nr:aldo/keto reductase [Emergencia timonensis]WNX88205.1 aldo/keto reductase [Emergencia timonensis]